MTKCLVVSFLLSNFVPQYIISILDEKNFFNGH